MFSQYAPNITIDGINYYAQNCSYVPAGFVEGVAFVFVNHPVLSTLAFMALCFFIIIVYFTATGRGIN